MSTKMADKSCSTETASETKPTTSASDTDTEANGISQQKLFENMKFPHKLWNIVNDCTSGAIAWSSSGSTILVNSEQFQDQYLTAGAAKFKTKNMASFIRQLNLYGFRKVGR